LTGNRYLGVDSLDMGISDMQQQKVFESMNSKKTTKIDRK